MIPRIIPHAINVQPKLLSMSPDEAFVTFAAVFAGPVLWALWVFQMRRVQTLQRGRSGVGIVALTLVACAVVVFAVLKTGASFDVVDDPKYLFMYVVVGLAWVRLVEMAFPFLGLSPRDDVVERTNRAAVLAVVGALIAVTLCYAGGNIGNGPGWWVVLFSAGLATGVLMIVWLALTQLTRVADAVTIDRDPAAGIRLGAFLVACGLVLGRGVAGDWESASATVADFLAVLPAVAAILIVAAFVESRARLTPERPRAPIVTLGVAPAIVYLVIAIVAVGRMGPPA